MESKLSSMPPMRLNRSRSSTCTPDAGESGQAMVEWLGVLVVVAVLIAGAVELGVGSAVAHGVSREVCTIFSSQHCATSTAPQRPPPQRPPPAPARIRPRGRRSGPVSASRSCRSTGRRFRTASSRRLTARAAILPKAATTRVMAVNRETARTRVAMKRAERGSAGVSQCRPVTRSAPHAATRR
jgi:hypothetical protein